MRMKALQAIHLALMLLALWAVPAIGAQQAQTDSVDCTDFAFQEDAPAVLMQDTSHPNMLDEDGDGVACEGLPKFTSTLPEGTPSCSSFEARADAQAYWDATDSAAVRRHLDEDGDGVACEQFDYSEPRPENLPGMPEARDQQGEMPGEMPDTGAGSRGSGTTFPAGNAVAGLLMLLGPGYILLSRHRNE